MPRIHGTWNRPAPHGGTWRLITPRIGSTVTGAEIVPPGVWDDGTLVVEDTGATSLDIDFPHLEDTLPADYQLKLILDFAGGDHEVYALGVNEDTGDIDLAPVIIPSEVPDSPASLVRGTPGGVAGLDDDGDVIDAAGTKVLP